MGRLQQSSHSGILVRRGAPAAVDSDRDTLTFFRFRRLILVGQDCEVTARGGNFLISRALRAEPLWSLLLFIYHLACLLFGLGSNSGGSGQFSRWV
jgi:hypothetical protein